MYGYVWRPLILCYRINVGYRKKSHNMRISCQIKTQSVNMKQTEINMVELENKDTKINNVTSELTKVAHIAIGRNVSNFNGKTNGSPMIENIQHTDEALPSVSSNTAENEEGIGSKPAKEQQENSQIENDHQAP